MYLFIQFAISGAVAGAALFVANIALDRWRRPCLEIDTSRIPVVPIEIPVFEAEDPLIPVQYRRFVLRYYVSRLIVRNQGRYAAENCKGVISTNEDELKVCWYLPSERARITINSNSLEYLDLCAVFDGDRNAAVLALVQRLTELRHYLDTLPRHSLERLEQISDLVNRLLRAYRTGEDIPLIIAPTEEGWQKPPAANRLLNPGNAEVIITSKNAPPNKRLIIILRDPDQQNRIVAFRDI